MIRYPLSKIVILSSLLAGTSSPIQQDSRTNKDDAITAHLRREARSRASIAGWNTRIRKQLAAREKQHRLQAEITGLLRTLCLQEGATRAAITHDEERTYQNMEAQNNCQICCEQYDQINPIGPAACTCIHVPYCMNCAEKIFANDAPRCPFCVQSVDTNILLHTICNLHVAKKLKTHEQAANISKHDWPLARRMLGMINSPEMPGNANLFTPDQNQFELFFSDNSDYTDSSDASSQSSSSDEEGYNLASDSSDTSSDASGNVFFFGPINDSDASEDEIDAYGY